MVDKRDRQPKPVSEASPMPRGEGFGEWVDREILPLVQESLVEGSKRHERQMRALYKKRLSIATDPK